MEKLLTFAGLLAVVSLEASAWEPARPIVTEEELHHAAAEVPVAKIDFVVPRERAAIEAALARRFFNRPEERRYSGVTNADWAAKWLRFSTALVEKAKNRDLEAESLERCLKALNRGRNQQTLLWPARDQKFFPTGTPKETKAAFEREAKEKYQRALKERDANPERWYDESLAIIPVGAYLAQHADGECWIIVCKWELVSGEPVGLGHIMIWAMDTKTTDVVGYVTCD